MKITYSRSFFTRENKEAGGPVQVGADIEVFVRQFIDVINAGLSLVHALDFFGSNVKTNNLLDWHTRRNFEHA